jgi:rod shape-determining protein MreC
MKKHKIIILFGFILLLFILYLAINPNRKLTYIEKYTKNSILWIEDKLEIPIHFIIDKFSNKITEDDLKKIEQYSLLESSLEEEKRKIEELESLLELKSLYTDYDIISASIIYRSSDNWYDLITINKGKKDGISEGMAVVVKDGLIGKITSVTNNTSVVKMITSMTENDTISIYINTLEESLYGLLYGYSNNQFIINGISSNSEIKEGDKVVTTGMDNLFPEGIIIGTVSNVLKDNFDLTKTIYIKPSVSFDRIDYVSVLKRNDNV